MSTIENGSSIFDNLGLTRPQDESRRNDETGQREFLQLMIAQLNNQDPFDPVDSKDFLAQIAQFSTVSGITELNQQFSELAGSMRSNQALQASTLVGRSVLVPSDYGVLGVDGSFDGAVDLQASTSSLVVNVYDTTGQLVRQLPLGEQLSGTVRFTWDGLNSEGQAVPPGKYQFAAGALLDGEPVAMQTLVVAPVQSVTLGMGGQQLTLNLGELGTTGFSAVREIL